MNVDDIDLVCALLFCVTRHLSSNRAGEGTVTWGKFPRGCDTRSCLLDKGGGYRFRGLRLWLWHVYSRSTRVFGMPLYALYAPFTVRTASAR